MSLRQLAVDIMFNADTNKLMAVNTAVDDIRDGAVDTSSSMEELGSATDSVTSSMMTRLEGIGDVMGNVGKKMTLGITTPLLGLGAAAIHTVAGFDDSMSKVKAISGATAEEFDQLREMAMDLGSSTSFSASQAADAMTSLATAGWDTNQILAATPDMLSLASAGGLELDAAASIVTNTMSQFGMEADRAGETADMFAVAAASANTDVTELGEAMKYAGGSATTMNMDLAQTNAVLATFASQGLVGSAAGTAFTAMFSDLSSKAKDGAVKIGDTVVAVYDASGAMRDMGSIMGDVESATDGMNDAQKNAALQNVFGIQSLKGVNIMLSEGADAYKEMESAIYDSEGAAASMAEEMEDNIGGSLRSMGSALEGFMIVLGDELKDHVRNAADFIGVMAGKFGELSPAVRQGIVFVGAFLAAIGPVLLLGSKMIGVFVPVVAMFGKISTAIKGAGGAFAVLSNPIGIAVLAIGLIIGAVVLAYNKIEWFRDAVNAAWEWIKNATSTAFGFISGIVSSVFGAAMEFAISLVNRFKDFWDTNSAFIMAIVQERFNSIVATIQMVMGIIQGIFEIAWPLITGIITIAWELIKTVISTAIDVVLGIISAGMAILQGDWSGAWEIIKGIGEDIWHNIEDFFRNVDLFQIGADILQGLIDGIGSMAQAVWDKVSSIAEGIASAFSGVLQIFSPSRLFKRFGVDTMVGYQIGFDNEADHAIRSSEDAAFNIADAFNGESNVPEYDMAEAFNVSPDYPEYPFSDQPPSVATPVNESIQSSTKTENKNEFHFHISGENARDIATEVRREVEKVFARLNAAEA